ncbi:MAG TPA: two-component regulator propeller domain-containing protein [Acidobacteriota bacterium]|nr:two-component regulator propeller domain-containing protein [Acidobacteriota bacterium]
MTRSGPSTGTVNTILRDRTGFLWLGTTNGLLRYDGYGFKAYRHDPDDDRSISGNHVWSICEDLNGDLWIGTSGRGLSRYVRREDRFQRYTHDPKAAGSLGGEEEVPWIHRDRRGRLWIALWEDGLDRYDRDTGRFAHYPIALEYAEGAPGSSVHRILEDHTGVLWLGTAHGLVRLHPDQNRLKLYRHDPANPKSLGGDVIYALHEDGRGRLWVGSRGGGLSLYDRDTDSFTVYTHDPRDASSVSGNLVTAIAQDQRGNLWVGTSESGLNRFDLDTEEFTRFAANPSASGSIRSNRIVSLHVDERGILWIGYLAEGLGRYHPGRRKFAHYRPGEGTAANVSEVSALLERKDGSVWVGTSGGGLTVYDADGRVYRSYRHRLEDSRGLSSNFISALAEDATGNLWIGTDEGGLMRMAPAQERFRCIACERGNRINALLPDRDGQLWIGTDGDAVRIYDPALNSFRLTRSDPASPFSSLLHVWAFCEDRNGDIWIGVWGEGACHYRKATDRLQCFKHDPKDPSSISSDLVISIAEDGQGTTWFGTWGEGLNSLPPGGRRFTRYTSADGLPQDTVVGILADPAGRVWVSTLDGLARYDPDSDRWKGFSRGDGLQSEEYRTGSYHRGPSGRLYFGGVNGFNAFFPDEVGENRNVPPIVVTSARVLDRTIPPSLLEAAGEGTPEIRLRYDQNFISFEFSALDFTEPQENQYVYRLEGLDRDWVTSGGNRLARYTDLSPGRYVFRVKGSNNDGVWNEEGTSIRLTITPPPWKTWWAYVLYVLAGGALLYAGRRYELNRLGLAHELRLKRLEARKLLELDRLKSRFFADVSHELRTPLTLILGPLQSLLEGTGGSDVKTLYSRMARNAERLLKLINELLDLSKLDAGAMALDPGSHDLVEVVRSVAAMFDSQAEARKVRLRTSLPKLPLIALVDRNKLEKAFSNLISNALKFTPSGGSVEVSIRTLAEGGENGNSAGERILVSVRDSGAGIPAHLLERVFDRFYQEEDAVGARQPGTGIGLALSKELVELHGGRIEVESEPAKGSCFTVTLPRRQAATPELAAAAGTVEAKRAVDSTRLAQLSEVPTGARPRKRSGARPLLLVVEDHSDMRRYISGILRPEFRIVEAGDGEAGLEKAFDKVPDLVISDVAMPAMDGFAFCRRLKGDVRSSHIPVILLTARADEQSRVEGLELGADDYLVKPFSAAELSARVRNLIETRRRLRERFRNEVALDPGAVAITTTDRLFLKRALKLIRENLSDSDFKVDRFARHFKLSRMQLHRKLKALTGRPAGEFIRHVRLRAAARMLVQGKYTVTEVAYEVGFNNLSYFARCFRRQYGVPPSRYRDER